jgi:hypothetical protein
MNSKQIFGVIGSAMLIFGLFVPLIQGPQGSLGISQGLGFIDLFLEAVKSFQASPSVEPNRLLAFAALLALPLSALLSLFGAIERNYDVIKLCSMLIFAIIGISLFILFFHLPVGVRLFINWWGWGILIVGAFLLFASGFASEKAVAENRERVEIDKTLSQDEKKKRMLAFNDILAKGTEDGARQVAELIASGSDVNQIMSRGMTPLIIATICNDLGTVEKLVSLGAYIRAADDDGRSALMHAAAKTSDPAIVEYLLNIGSNPHARDDKGMRAVDYALQNAKLADTKALRVLEEASK